MVRFFLGGGEAGIWPAILVLISHWFLAAERARLRALDDEYRHRLHYWKSSASATLCPMQWYGA